MTIGFRSSISDFELLSSYFVQIYTLLEENMSILDIRGHSDILVSESMEY